MRLSRLFGRTLRRAPAEAETDNYQLLLRAKLVEQLAAGVYSYLPLGWEVARRIQQIIKEEMDDAGGQEVHMPVIQPSDLWVQSGRRFTVDVLFTLRDKRDREMVLGPTHEEVVTDLVRRNVQSYRDLPQLLYQIQTKFRDEPRPRGGLIRVREFIMKDLYSFDSDWEALDRSYDAMFHAYLRIFERCGVTVVPVLADSGAIGGKDSQEFLFLTEIGEDTALICPNCRYAANAEKAEFRKPRREPEEPLPLEELATPGQKTIDDLVRFTGKPHAHTLKAVFYKADGAPVFVAIRGDLDVNEIKLKNALKAVELTLLDDNEVRSLGLVAGSASPVGLQGMKVVADDSVLEAPNLIAGANRPDIHYVNVNYPRDWTADLITDIALARAGAACPTCGHALEERRGIEMGHVFKLGTVYSEKLGASFLDQDGQSRPVVMGCYGMGVERILAAAIEANHDERGIIWPEELAPFRVHLVALNLDRDDVRATAERLYDELRAAGVRTLYDDREESAGVKFNDADLLGMPWRVTVSPRTLERHGVEVKRRTVKEAETVPLEGATTAIVERARR
ncbi:MAG: proline--tRNA ligase [Dehalococcoidia bacterium]